MRQLQAASALGQAQLQQAWERAFRRVGLQAAQILLSPADVADRQTYVNVCNTFDALFRLGAVPVVNENDATATDEITFGDNDALAAQVAVLDARAAARAAHRGRRRLLARAGYAGRGAARRRLADVRRPAGPRRPVSAAAAWGARSRPRELAAGAGIPTVIASGQAEAVLVPIVAGERARHSLRRRRAPERVGVQALDQVRQAAAWHASCSMRAPSGRCARRARASSPSA